MSLRAPPGRKVWSQIDWSLVPMSMVHFLTIGRFAFTEGSFPPELVDRVVAHFLPGGLRRSGRETSYVVPWNEGELRALEEEVERRFDLEVDLDAFLTPEGLLRIQYTGMQENIAHPVAVVAHELFGAVAGERGEVHSQAGIELECRIDVARNAARRRILAIKDGVDRVRAVVENLIQPAVPGGALPVHVGVATVADVAPHSIPALVDALTCSHSGVRNFSCFALAEIGVPAAEAAVPSLTGLVLDHEAGFSAVHALAAMGQGAEVGLARVLDHPDSTALWSAIQALAKLDHLSKTTRARLRLVAIGANVHHARAAREALERARA